MMEVPIASREELSDVCAALKVSYTASKKVWKAHTDFWYRLVEHGDVPNAKNETEAKISTEEVANRKKQEEFKASESARKKRARGLDPSIDNRKTRRKPDETSAAFDKRLQRNRRNAELQRMRYYANKPDNWQPKPRFKLTDEERRANAAARMAKSRLKKKQIKEANATPLLLPSDDEL